MAGRVKYKPKTTVKKQKYVAPRRTQPPGYNAAGQKIGRYQGTGSSNPYAAPTTKPATNMTIPANRVAAEYAPSTIPWYKKSLPNPNQVWNKLQWYAAGGDRPPGMGEMYRYPREPQNYYPYYNPGNPPGANPDLDIRNTAVQEYMQRFTANNFSGRSPNYKPVNGTEGPAVPKVNTKQKTYAPGKMTGQVPANPQTSGVLPEDVYPEYPTTDTGGGYGGYGGGYGGGGGGYTSSSYSSPFAEYKQGYAMQGVAPAAQQRFGTPGQAQQYSNAAQTQYPARWQQLLTSWRI